MTQLSVLSLEIQRCMREVGRIPHIFERVIGSTYAGYYNGFIPRAVDRGCREATFISVKGEQ